MCCAGYENVFFCLNVTAVHISRKDTACVVKIVKIANAKEISEIGTKIQLITKVIAK